MTREELKNRLEKLLEQDKELVKIHNRRKIIEEKERKNELHVELWEMLFAEERKNNS